MPTTRQADGSFAYAPPVDIEDPRAVEQGRVRAEQERAEREAAHAANLTRLRERYQPTVDAWPTRRGELQATLNQAHAELLDALRTDPAFGAFLRWIQADYELQQAQRHYSDARWLTQHGKHSPYTDELTRPVFTEQIDQLLTEARQG